MSIAFLKPKDNTPLVIDKLSFSITKRADHNLTIRETDRSIKTDGGFDDEDRDLLPGAWLTVENYNCTGLPDMGMHNTGNCYIMRAG